MLLPTIHGTHLGGSAVWHLTPPAAVQLHPLGRLVGKVDGAARSYDHAAVAIDRPAETTWPTGPWISSCFRPPIDAPPQARHGGVDADHDVAVRRDGMGPCVVSVRVLPQFTMPVDSSHR